jgi:hypothetical protein
MLQPFVSSNVPILSDISEVLSNFKLNWIAIASTQPTKESGYITCQNLAISHNDNAHHLAEPFSYPLYPIPERMQLPSLRTQAK